MVLNPEITSEMRQKLIAWLVSIHNKFLKHDETLYITVSLIDRYCAVREVRRADFQLVGAAAMLIAGKFQELKPLLVKDFVDFTGKSYTHAQIVKQEYKILKALEFGINVPTAYTTLMPYCERLDSPYTVLFLAHYIIELSLHDARLKSLTPEVIASSALHIANCTF